MDTKTIMTVLAMLGGGALLEGCDRAAEGGHVSPESKADNPAPVKTEAPHARPDSKPTEPPTSARPEAVQARPEIGSWSEIGSWWGTASTSFVGYRIEV